MTVSVLCQCKDSIRGTMFQSEKPEKEKSQAVTAYGGLEGAVCNMFLIQCMMKNLVL